jgi:S1-C subfamily serine protease
VGRIFEVFTDEFLKKDPESERQWKEAKRMVRTFWNLAEGRPLPPMEGRESERDRVLPVPKTRPDSIRETSSSLQLGVRGGPVDLATRLQIGLEGRHGMLIEEVTSGSSGDRSGLRRGDVLLAVEGRDVGTIKEIDECLSKISGDRKVRMRIRRGGRTIELVWER